DSDPRARCTSRAPPEAAAEFAETPPSTPTPARSSFAPTMVKQLYFFGSGHADGDAKQKDLLGGKGAGLAEMTRLGIPVPPGFTLTTEVCTSFFAAGGKLPDGLAEEIRASLGKVGDLVGARFGDAEAPLLVS